MTARYMPVLPNCFQITWHGPVQLGRVPAHKHVRAHHLPEWVAFAARPEASHLDFHQCPMGAETAKPTRLFAFGVQLEHLAFRSQKRFSWAAGKKTQVSGWHAHTTSMTCRLCCTAQTGPQTERPH